MTKIILAIVVGLSIIIFLAAQPEPVTYTNYPPKQGPVVAFGDSLVAGVGSTGGGDFVSLIASKIGEPVINMGVPGNTTKDGLARISTVIEKQPRVVLVLLGGNDYLKHVPIEETFANLDAIITKIHESGSMVVLLGVQGGVLSDPFAPKFRELAKKHDLIYVPNIFKGVIGDGSLMADTIHPNNAGYAIIADRIYEAAYPFLK